MTCSSASSSDVPGSEEDLPDTKCSACCIAKVGVWQGNPVERRHHVKTVGLDRHARRGLTATGQVTYENEWCDVEG
jgi:hypothetical protein